MKANLNLSMGQHLTLTPQLQQAIRLLQLSTLELNQEIQQAIESNPMLEPESNNNANQNNDNTAKQTEADNQVEPNWETYYTPTRGKQNNSDDLPSLEATHGTEVSLQDHLYWQMELTPFSDIDKAIATAIIDAIDESGFLQCELSDIQQAVLSNAPDDLVIELDEIEAVLHLIQRFDPIGVGSRDLRECLLRQLETLPEETPHLKLIYKLVDKYLEELAQRNFAIILRQCRINQETLSEAFQVIQTLTPHPGDLICTPKPEYIIPDVIVKQQDDRFTVELNPEALPRIRINSHYAGMVKRANNSTDNQFLKNNLQEARWFIKSIQSRQDTLLRVATAIVNSQQGFFRFGEEAMKPMVLHDIASELELHESTISRVTTNKYMHTPRGVFELKYFFSSHVGTATGGECSSTAIRAIIKKLVASENQIKPLSDQKIALLLQDKGINVARRTIAKYREAMNIPPSNERKSLLSNR